MKRGNTDYLKRIGIFFMTMALIVGMASCDGMSCGPPGGATQYDLIMSSTAGGSVIDPGEGTFTYDEGTVVTLEAVADSDYHFVNWTGDVSTIDDVNDATTSITMNGDYSIVANFEADEETPPPVQHNLTISSTAGGNVTTPGEGTFIYDEGAEVNLVAEAEESYCFDQWSGDVSTVADVYDTTTTISMSGNYSITANFILFAGGSGTEEDPFQVGDWYNLNNTRNYPGNYYFVLVGNLDAGSAGYDELASETADSGKEWLPIGHLDDPSVSFNGTFDGQGYSISDLFINRTDTPGVGLFGYVYGTIENVGVADASVTGSNDVGILIGRNYGTVNNSYATGTATGEGNNAGGLVGRNDYGTIHNSYSTGSVTDSNNVGGLVGYNYYGTVDNSYSTGDVTGDRKVGGLVGYNEYGTVDNSYSTGSVTGGKNLGGLVGVNDGAVSNSFWDTETSGLITSAGGTGKTTAQMMDITTFTGALWDIIAVADSGTRDTSYIWNVVDGVTYPFLSWQG
jgi:hypothetical protein